MLHLPFYTFQNEAPIFREASPKKCKLFLSSYEGCPSALFFSELLSKGLFDKFYDKSRLIPYLSQEFGHIKIIIVY